MHELSVTTQLMNITIKECIKNKANPNKIIIELGELTTYKEEPLKYYFSILKKEEKYILLKNTKLKINKTPGKLNCKKCNKTSKITDPRMILCPLCNSSKVDITDGKDLKIKTIVCD